jgi:hypothetical protein
MHATEWLEGPEFNHMADGSVVGGIP